MRNLNSLKLRCVLILCLTLGGWLASSASASAQVTDSIKQNTPFQVAADHDGLDTDSYRIYLNGTVWQTKLVTALVSGVITFDFPVGLAKGIDVIYIEAIGPGGVTGSDTLTLTVTPGQPKKPLNIRLIKTATPPAP